jgi:hypothetical protein
MAQLDCGLVTTEGTGGWKGLCVGFGFGAGQGMVSGVGSGRRALKGPGIPPSQCPLFRSHAFAVLFPAHRCRCSPSPCISAYGRGWEELGSARGGLGVGRSISGHQLSLAPGPGYGQTGGYASLDAWMRGCDLFGFHLLGSSYYGDLFWEIHCCLQAAPRRKVLGTIPRRVHTSCMRCICMGCKKNPPTTQPGTTMPSPTQLSQKHNRKLPSVWNVTPR